LFLSWRQTDDDLNVIVSLIDNKRDKSGSYSKEDEIHSSSPFVFISTFPVAFTFFYAINNVETKNMTNKQS